MLNLAILTGTSLSISVSPTSVSGAGTAGTIITTNAATVSVAGASGAVTFSWAIVSGFAYTINSPSSASTTFKDPFAPHGTRNAVASCTVTDAAGQVATVNVNVSTTAP